MKVIDRYIGRELVAWTILGLGLSTFVLLTEKILKLLELVVIKRIPLGTVARMFLYLLPPLFVLTIPVALLLAIITTYSRLAAEHELTAFKAAGCSLYRLTRPAFGICLLAMIVAAFNTVYAVPWGTQAFQDLLFVLTRTRATIGLKEGVFNDDFHGLILYTNTLDEDEGVMRGVFVVDTQNKQKPRIITARQGRILPDETRNVVLLQLQEGLTQVAPKADPGVYQMLRFHKLDLALSVGEPTSAGAQDMDPDGMRIPEILAELRQGGLPANRIAGLKFSLHRRLAAPVACLVFLLLGTPLAVRVRRSGRGISLGLTIALTLAYYVLMVIGRGMGRNGMIAPFWGVWLPNLLLGGLGVILFIGGNRESWLPPSILVERLRGLTAAAPPEAP